MLPDTTWSRYYYLNKNHLNKNKEDFTKWFWARGYASSSGCWLWKKCFFDGYGRVNLYKKSFLAHRIAYELYHGREITKGLFVCHTCDIRACYNPFHLFEGTQQDNIDDCIKKKRNVFGSFCHVAILSEKDILQIFIDFTCNSDVKMLEQKYNISGATIRRILKRNIWKNVEIPDNLIQKAKQKLSIRFVTANKLNELSKQLHISPNAIKEREGRILRKLVSEKKVCLLHPTSKTKNNNNRV